GGLRRGRVRRGWLACGWGTVSRVAAGGMQLGGLAGGCALLAGLSSRVVIGANVRGNLAVFPGTFYLERRKRNVGPWLPIDPLLCQRFVIDRRLVVGLFERLVRECCPPLTDCGDLLREIRQSEPHPLVELHVDTGFGAEPRRRDLPCSHQQMSVIVA